MKQYAIPHAQKYREQLTEYRHKMYRGEDPPIGDVCEAMLQAEDALEEFIAERDLAKSIVSNMTIENSVDTRHRMNPGVMQFAGSLLKEFKNKVLTIYESNPDS